MQEGTARLQAIVEDLEQLVAESKAGKLYLREPGHIACLGFSLKTILKAQMERERGVPAHRIPRGAMDRSVPTGDL